MQYANANMQYANANPATTSVASLPRLSGEGPSVVASRQKASGTYLWLAIGYGLVVLLVFASVGIILFALALGWAIDMLFGRRILTRLRGSSLQVGPAQLPELDRCVREFSYRLGLREPPIVLVAESSDINAFALRAGKRRCVLLMDDTVWAALEAGLPDALRFVVAHELAHHALGHTGFVRAYLRTILPQLSRLDELSADAVALQLVGTREAAYEGIMMLTVGPQMLKYTNRSQLLQQAAEIAADRTTRKAERPLRHPLLLRRLHTLSTLPLG
jgi:Zn-dependent protease with chaperone function